ncbi:MAG: cation:proton antiporter [Kofleriaceae bacterium]
MSWLHGMALISAILLLMALASSRLRALPVSTSILYLGFGMFVGPWGLGLLHLDLVQQATVVEHVAEVAVIVSLFAGGLRLRARLSDRAWRAAFLLAGPVMVISILGVALVGHLALGLPPAIALLVGAILAPTDPVLASSVTVNDAADADRMRYALSGEAGFNDGTAFPFVILALGWAQHAGAGTWLFEWAAVRLLWAIPAALLLGFFLGKLVGQLAIKIRAHHRDSKAPSDLLALALIGLAYVVAEAVGAWGFLAVFAAGLGLRAAEVKSVTDHPHPDVPADADEHPPAEDLVPTNVDGHAVSKPAIAAGVLVSETLSFSDTIERLVEFSVIVAVGVALSEHWDARALVVAAALFVVVRPFATWACLSFTTTTRHQRTLIAWFGIRGIGSLYYLAYALTHGIDPARAAEIVGLCVSVVAASIVVHGLSSTPLLAHYERALRAAHPR